jgi:transcriptional regulator with XRE-family HTH domain
MATFGTALKASLKEEELTQRDLAKTSGFNQSQISRFCTDSVPNNPKDFWRVVRGLSKENQEKLFHHYMEAKVPKQFAALKKVKATGPVNMEKLSSKGVSALTMLLERAGENPSIEEGFIATSKLLEV